MVEPHADPTDRHVRNVADLVTALACGTLSLYCLLNGLRQPAFWWWWLMAVVLGGIAASSWATSGHGRAQHRRLDVDGPRLTIGFRRAVAVGWTGGCMSFAAFMAWGVVFTWGEGLFWLIAPTAVVMVTCAAYYAPVPFRACRLVLDTTGLSVVSWFEEGRVAWDDLEHSVDFEPFSHRSHQLRVRVRPGARSLELRRRRLSGRVQPGDHGSFRIPADALDEPVRVAAALGLMASARPQARPFHLAVTVPRMLRRETP